MMDENDDLYFSFEDEPEGGEFGEGLEEGQKGGNRTFLIAVIALAAISVLGIGAFVIFFLLGGRGDQQVSANEMTNQANMTLLAETQAAEVGTEMVPTDVPLIEPATEEPALEEPTATPTTALVLTPVEPTEEPTEEGAAAEPTGESTEVAEAAEPTQLAAAATPTGSGIIEVTPLGGAEPAESGSEATGGETPAPQTGGEASSEQPAAEATLPQTGLTTMAGLAGAGILAIALVVVAVVARRIRMQ